MLCIRDRVKNIVCIVLFQSFEVERKRKFYLNVMEPISTLPVIVTYFGAGGWTFS
jgi:hypothetical protein